MLENGFPRLRTGGSQRLLVLAGRQAASRDLDLITYMRTWSRVLHMGQHAQRFHPQAADRRTDRCAAGRFSEARSKMGNKIK